MVLIYEVFPNPVGNDVSGEWIKLYNSSENFINLSGWKLKDRSGKTFILSNKEIAPKNFLVLSLKEAKISLNNSGDTLFLYNQNNQLIDKAQYQFNVAEGVVLYREEGSSILKQKSQSSKSIKENQIISLEKQEPIMQTEIINYNTFSTKLIIIIPSLLFLALIILIIIKKLHLIYDD